MGEVVSMPSRGLEKIYLDAMIRREVPEHCRAGLLRYLMLGIPPGSFLQSLISNDLTGAVARADAVNAQSIKSYIDFLHHEVSMECWGSVKRYEDWVAMGGAQGIARTLAERQEGKHEES